MSGTIRVGVEFGPAWTSVGVSVPALEAPPGLLAAPGKNGDVAVDPGAIDGVGAANMTPITARSSTTATARAVIGTRGLVSPNSLLSITNTPDLAARAERQDTAKKRRKSNK